MSQSASHSQTDPQQSNLLRVCRIGRAQGLKGEVNVSSFTDEPELRFAPESVLLTKADHGQEPRQFVVERSRSFKTRWIVKFEGVEDRTAAEALNGTTLYAERLDESDDWDDEDEGYYLSDLVGLKALATDGTTVLGTISDVIDRPGQSLLELTEPQGSISLVPFVEQIVPEVDLEAGTVSLDPPGGLLQEH